MGIFHVLLIMVLEKRVKLQSLKFAVSIDQVYNVMQCLLISIRHPQKGFFKIPYPSGNSTQASCIF